MYTISEGEMGLAMWQNGALAVLHRYNTIEEQCALVDKVIGRSGACVAAAIGTSGDYLERATALYDAGATLLCVDVAHGHHILMKEALYQLRNILRDGVHIMAGNVATLVSVRDGINITTTVLCF